MILCLLEILLPEADRKWRKISVTMLVVEPGDSLKHIQTRKILDAIAMQNEKDGSLGSDGETSDYQRSTPSPQDSNARITELSEGLEKAESESPPPLPVTPSEYPSPAVAMDWNGNPTPRQIWDLWIMSTTPAPAPAAPVVLDPFIFLKNQKPEECHIPTPVVIVLVVIVGYLYQVIK